MERFRPSIVLDGCLPYEEEEVDVIELGEASLRRIHPCPRCPVTTVDHLKGEKDQTLEPLKTVRKVNQASEEKWPLLKKKGTFGTVYSVVKTGRICLGDDVYAV